MIEERHAHLERAGHRGAVEVGEHVVHEPEPRVEEQRGLERGRARRLGQVAGGDPARRVLVIGERSAEQLGPQVGVDQARGRDEACHGVGRLQRFGQAPGAARAAPHRGRGGARAASAACASSARPARPPGACGSRRTARRLPGPRARPSRGETASSERARKPSEDRSASGSSRCQVSRDSVSGSLVRSTSSSWCSRPAELGHAAGVGQLRVLARRTRPRTSARAGPSCRAISATIRLESRPPLSIAPSGTSLIRRIRTDSSSRASSSSLHSASDSEGSACGSGAG